MVDSVQDHVVLVNREYSDMRARDSPSVYRPESIPKSYTNLHIHHAASVNIKCFSMSESLTAELKNERMRLDSDKILRAAISLSIDMKWLGNKPAERIYYEPYYSMYLMSVKDMTSVEAPLRPILTSIHDCFKVREWPELKMKLMTVVVRKGYQH